ncbi:MAG: hypothetical protein QXM12_07295 [Nitrososphaerota archaeon]
MNKQVIFLGTGGLVSAPQENGFVIMPYAGETIETPLFKGYRVINLHPFPYALYRIEEVKPIGHTSLFNKIEKLNIHPAISPEKDYAVVAIDPDMIENALSWGALGFGVEMRTKQLIAVFSEQRTEGDGFAEFYDLPIDFLFASQFLFALSEAEENTLQKLPYEKVYALYDGDQWLIYSTHPCSDCTTI